VREPLLLGPRAPRWRPIFALRASTRPARLVGTILGACRAP